MTGRGQRTPRDSILRRLAMGLVAIPFLAASASLLLNHWSIRSFGDDAVIELRTRTAFSVPILVGQVSRLNTRSLGPLWNYLMNPVYWIFGGRSIGMFVGAAWLNCACSIWAVAVLLKHKGVAVGIVFATSILMLTVALQPGVYANPWNPNPVVFALPLLFALGWAVADGDDSQMMWFVLVGSYTIQTHLSGLLLTLVLLAAVMLARLIECPRSRPSRRDARRAIIVGVAVWSPPIIEMLTKPPGNFARVAKFLVLAKDHPSSMGDGVRIATHALAIPPAWMLGYPSASAAPSVVAYISAGAVVSVVVWVVWVAIRRLRRDLTFPLLVSVLLIAGIVVSVWRTVGELIDYTVLWTVPASMVIWFSVGWAAFQIAPSAQQAVQRLIRSRSAAVKWTAGALVAFLLVIACAQSTQTPPTDGQTKRIISISDAIHDATTTHRSVVFEFVPQRGGLGLELDQALVVDLVKRDRDVATTGMAKWFDDRDRPPRSGDQLVVVTSLEDGAPDPSRHGEVLYDDGVTRVDLLSVD